MADFERKYVQILKSDGFVNLIGDESLGMWPTDNDTVHIFDISKHPQNAEIVPWMRYNEETDTFYFPEQTPQCQPLPTITNEQIAHQLSDFEAKLIVAGVIS